MTNETTDRDKRRQEFHRIFRAIPGRNIDRIRRVAEVLHCQENTVRFYLLKTANARVIPAGKLEILRAGVKS